jgi:hypothetical protein
MLQNPTNISHFNLVLRNSTTSFECNALETTLFMDLAKLGVKENVICEEQKWSKILLK